MNCPDCGAENLEGAAYCEDCGSKLPVGAPAAGGAAPAPPPAADAPPPVMTAGGMIKCASCGAENPATEAYCEDCGAGLGGAAVPAAGDTPPQAPAAGTPVMAAASIGKLALISGTHEFLLNKDVITLGRRSPADGIYPDVDLTDHDPESYVSRRHAQIIRQNTDYIFEDVGSANGSFVNNARATKGVQQVLKDGDQVRLGKTEMVYKAAGS
jgi:hypothetical protein